VSAELVLFGVLAVGTVGTALAMILARNVVHAVLFMVVNFGLTAVLYLMLQAPFLAAVQVIVYAGAIMVLFLFVVMLLGKHEAALDEPLAGQRLWGVAFAGILGALLVFVVGEGVPAAPPRGVAADALPALPGGFGSPAAVGDALFGRFVLPFEAVGILLLVAVVGAVVIARFHRSTRGIGPSSPPEGDG